MTALKPALLGNGEPIDLSDIPVLDEAAFKSSMLSETGTSGRLAAYFAVPEENDLFRLFAIIAHDEQGALHAFSSMTGKIFASLTPHCAQAHLFERVLAEDFGILPTGHPWLKPVRFPAAKAGTLPAQNPEIGSMQFFRVEGESVHEVAVGPVHAGVIEPGHFRFQCHGEEVFNLEISLGYQHRGIEQALLGGPDKTTLAVMETIAGDTTIGHSLAYCQAIDGLGGGLVPHRAQALRGIALELERCANHTGDLGALAGDVGFLPTASFCGRLRGDFLNLSALLCGSRFGRGLIVPGGVGFDVDSARIRTFCELLAKTKKDVLAASQLLFGNASVLARFENTGMLTMTECRQLGIVGPAARACGLLRDVRQDFPVGIYTMAHLPVVTAEKGDVFSRAFIRLRELQQSMAFIETQIQELPTGPIAHQGGTLSPNALVVSLTEGWRGEICHVAMTNQDSRFSRYVIVDPSFHNWAGLSMALRGQQISDFPLCNKSFNLSYCGQDL